MTAYPASNLRSLFRYNYRVLIGHTYWLLVIPIAVSQLITAWHMAMASSFRPYIGAQIAELVAPLLAAFLSAHILGNEYRSHIGPVIISKPLHIGKIVFFRLLAIYLFVALLVGVTMSVICFGVNAFDIRQAALAGIPSTIYLSLLSMTFAAIFRHPMIGFLLAAFLWTLDLLLGFSFHPLLSLQGLAARWEDHPLKLFFWPNKIALLLASAILYGLHRRVMLTLAETENRKRGIRRAGWVFLFLFLYIYSGAVGKMIYGLRHKGSLPASDIIWFRKEFRIYEPVPVAWLFGKAFAYYIGYLPPWVKTTEETGGFIGENKEHLAQLQWIVENAPGSIWADSSLYLLATLKRLHDEEGRSFVPDFKQLVQDYPDSPFAPLGLEDLGKNAAQNNDPETARWAFDKILSDYPVSRSVLSAARFTVEDMMGQGKPLEAARAAQTGEKAAGPYEKPGWIMQAAELLKSAGDTGQARSEYARARQSARDALALLKSRKFEGTPLQETTLRDSLRKIEQEAEKAMGESGS
ncbi:MAG: hypothetical protein IT210_04045 [Armatimonadetes bacterium]|nr:hypothetical protein [Armatimonadota bacterium]